MPRGRPRKIQSGAFGGSLTGAVSNLAALHADLLAQRAALDNQISAVANALRAIGQPVMIRTAYAPGRKGPGRGAGRGGWRTGSLKAYIAQVLRGGGVMAVKDITAAVVKSGYKSKNKTLAKSVGIALREMAGVAKVGRGKFKLG